MVDNIIALERDSDNTFKKKVKNINDKMKKGRVVVNKANVKQPAENYGRGVVYLGHIPHGFYEDQLQDYFCQFGKITNLKVARSAKTGKSKGFAYIEFQYSEVAKVVAETMHNYIMCNRLLKADYIPSEKINGNTFWGGNTAERYAKAHTRRQALRKLNNFYQPNRVRLIEKRKKRHISGVLGKLHANGIEYNFQPTLIVRPQPSAPVMLLDESDDEVQFKVADTVRVLKRPASSSPKESENIVTTMLNQKSKELFGKASTPSKKRRLATPRTVKGDDSTPGKKQKLATPRTVNQKVKDDDSTPGKKQKLVTPRTINQKVKGDDSTPDKKRRLATPHGASGKTVLLRSVKAVEANSVEGTPSQTPGKRGKQKASPGIKAGKMNVVTPSPVRMAGVEKKLTPHRTPLTVQKILKTSIQTVSLTKKGKKSPKSARNLIGKVYKASLGNTPTPRTKVTPTVSIKKLVNSMTKKLQETVKTPRIRMSLARSPVT